MKLKCLTAFLLLLFAALSVGCATTSQENQSVSKSDEEESQSIDPYEDINRPLYDFTDTIDRKILAPVADTYIDYIPKPLSEISMTILRIQTLLSIVFYKAR